MTNNQGINWICFGFFQLSLIISSWAVAAVDCIPSEYNSTGVVKYVNDGDTFTLEDGRKIRLVGIDAPEVNRLYPERSEPLAQSATIRLQQLLPVGSKVMLRHDLREKDKYGRTLAIVVNQRQENVSQRLLEAGLARQYWLPPNYYAWLCYALHERSARDNRIGLWALAENYPRSAVTVEPEDRRLVDVVGKITQIEESPTNFWLVLDNRVRVGIEKENFHLFAEHDLRTQLLQTARITGKVYQAYGSLRMQLEHPWQFTLITSSIKNLQ